MVLSNKNRGGSKLSIHVPLVTCDGVQWGPENDTCRPARQFIKKDD
jgi:hypothetical protein